MGNISTTISSQNIDKTNQSFIDRKNKNNLSLKFDVMPPNTYLKIVTLQKAENHTFYITCNKSFPVEHYNCSAIAQLEALDKYIEILTTVEIEKLLSSELNKTICNFTKELNSILTKHYNPQRLESLKLSLKSTGDINDTETAIKYLECFVNSSATLNDEHRIISDYIVYKAMHLILESIIYAEDIKIINLAKKILTDFISNESLPERAMFNIIDKITPIAIEKKLHFINKTVLIDLLHNFIVASTLNSSLLDKSLDCLIEICLHDDEVDPFYFPNNPKKIEEYKENKKHTPRIPIYVGQRLNRYALNRLSYIMNKESIPIETKQAILIKAKSIAEQYTSFSRSADKTTVSSRTHKKLIDFIEKTQINLAEIQTKQNNASSSKLTD